MSTVNIALQADANSRKRNSNSGFRRLLKSPSGMIGSVLILILVLAALFAPLLTPYGPDDLVGRPLQAPFGEFVLGTDELGRDILTIVLYGARVSLLVGVLGAGTACLVGIIIGSIAGYFQGAVDNVLMRFAEMFQILPALIIALVAASLFGGSLVLVVLVIAFAFWPDSARLVRSGFLTLRERDFVKAAKVSGISTRYIIFSEIAPNALPPLIAQTALNVGWAILVETGLSFLGVGDVNLPSWGKMLNSAQSYLATAPWLSIIPGIAVVLTVLAFNFTADGISKVLNPRRSSALMSRKALAENSVAVAAESNETVAATSEPRSLLEIKDLVFHLNVADTVVKAVDGVSVVVGEGERVGIVGESGSGKSTLMRLAAGLVPPVEVASLSGTVRFDQQVSRGRELGDPSRISRRGGISMIFQDPMGYLNPTMRIGDQIAEGLPPEMPKSEKDRVVTDLLARVELPRDARIEERYPHQISGGQRQRAMIALALALKPRLLIADEPTTALDATVQAQIVQTLMKIHDEEKIAFAIITHDLGLISRTCERVYVMRAGKVVEEGTVEQVFENPQHPYTQMLMAARPGQGSPRKHQASSRGDL